MRNVSITDKIGQTVWPGSLVVLPYQGDLVTGTVLRVDPLRATIRLDEEPGLLQRKPWHLVVFGVDIRKARLVA